MRPAREDIDFLKCRLAHHEALEWLVYGQPVVALFSPSRKAAYSEYDREYLGQPSPHKSADKDLRLWVGFDDNQGRLAIAMTQRIVVSAGRKPRLFYFCIPVESLVLSTFPPAFWNMSDSVVPLKAVDNSGNMGSTSAARLLRVSLSLGRNKSWVIMPNFPHTGSVSLEAMSLLRKLKALSEAPQFDLFTCHNSWVQRSFCVIQELLSRRKVSYPTIDHAQFYPAGRDAVVDAWEAQGWRPIQDNVEQRHEKTTDATLPGTGKPLKRKRDPVVDLDQRIAADTLPPPYKASNSPPLLADADHLKGAGHDAGMFGAQPGQRTSEGGDTDSMFSLLFPVRDSVESSLSPSAPQRVVTSQHGVPRGSVRYAFTRASINCSSFAATRIDEQALPNASDDAISTRHSDSATSSTYGDISQPNANLNLPSLYHTNFTPPHCKAGLPRGSEKLSPSMSPTVVFPSSSPETASAFARRLVAPYPSLSCMSCKDVRAKECTTPICEHSTAAHAHTSDELDERGSSASHVPDTPRPSLAVLPQPGTNTIRGLDPDELLDIVSRHRLMSLLLRLWKLCPYAHYVCVVDLIRLTIAVRDSDADLFHDARARSVTTLVQHCAQAEHDRDTSPITSTKSIAKSGRIYQLVSWLSLLDSEADLVFLEQLGELAKIDEQTERNEAFAEKMAAIVVDACTLFGSKTLHCYEDIASISNTRRERVRDIITGS